MCWSSADGSATDCLTSGCMVGRRLVILFIPLVGYVVAWVVIVIVWLCVWSRTVVHVLVRFKKNCVVGHVLVVLFIPLVVGQKFWEEDSLVVVLVQKFACGKLVV